MKDKNKQRKFQEYQDYRNKQLVKGLKSGKIFTYPKALIDYLRPYHYGGIPISIMVLINELCNGRCYERAIMISLAFDDAKIIHGDIESLRLSGSAEKNGENYAEHAFVETTEFGGGKTWVVDTSIGLVYEKDLYYKLEKVKVKAEFSKEEIMETGLIKTILAGDFEKDKWGLPIYLPIIEQRIENSDWFGTIVYKDFTMQEVQKFKTAIGYADMEAEIEADLILQRTNPEELEKKFKIVRDRYGREISRNGVPNPYYISPEEADAMQARFDAVKDNPEALAEYWRELAETEIEKMRKEYEEIDRLANERLVEILENPTLNFYDKQMQ